MVHFCADVVKLVDTVDSKSAYSDIVLVRVQSSAFGFFVCAMHWILDYSPIFFDFDGLLVNTEHLHFQAYQKMLEKNGVSFPWDFFSFALVAHKSAEGLRQLITSHAPELVSSKSWERLYHEKREEYAKILAAGHLQLMPGAKYLLEMVQKAKIPHAVVTNSTQNQTDMIRKKIPFLNTISHWITREDYLHPKPAPDAYRKAVERLGGSKKMLGFEDTLRGALALESASITPVLICPLDHPQMGEVAGKSWRHYPSLVNLF